MKRFLILILFIALIYLAYDILGSYTHLYMRAGMDGFSQDDLNQAIINSLIFNTAKDEEEALSNYMKSNINEHIKLVFPIELQKILSKSKAQYSFADEVKEWSKANNLLPNDDALRISTAKDTYGKSLKDIGNILQPWKLDEVYHNVPNDVKPRHANNETFANLLKDHLQWKWSIGDGNCFFIALKQCLEATGLMGKLNSYRMRAEIVKFMRDHTNTSERHLEYMRKNDIAYAENNEIKAACILYNINIISIKNPDSSNKFSVINKFGEIVNGTTIWLQHSGSSASGHFDSLIYTDKYNKKIVDTIEKKENVKVLDPGMYPTFRMEKVKRADTKLFNTARIIDNYSSSYYNNGSKNRNRYYLLLQVISKNDLEHFLDLLIIHITDNKIALETYRDIKDMTYIGTDYDENMIQLRDLYNLPMDLSRTASKDKIKEKDGIEVLDFTDFHYYLLKGDINKAIEAKNKLMNVDMQPSSSTAYFLPIVKPKNINLTFRYEIWKIISKFPKMRDDLDVKAKSNNFLKAYDDGALTREPKHSTAMFVDMNTLTVREKKVGITEEGIREKFLSYNK